MATNSFGKYVLIAELGRGGMADVFLAVQAGPAGSGFRKLIVVKRLRDNLAEDPQFVRMLVDEARIAARLNHPNVVQTYEVGQVEHQHFIAMEYLDGQPLHRIQYRAMKGDTTQGGEAEGLKSPLMKSLQYIVLVDVAAGLHHAHTLKDFDGTRIEIVHRDVTPHNIFVTYEGSVKVVDFGIAKAAGRAQETAHGVVKGKIRYMAPEQALGLALDARADIFSLGVMLWEAATGRRLWHEADEIRIVTALATGEIPSSPRAVDPTVPEALDEICRKALAKNRDDRYATAEEFRLALEQYLAETGQLLTARRLLGPKVSELFKDKREEIEVVIEKCVAKLEVGTSMPPPALGPLDTNPSGSISSGLVARSAHSAVSGTAQGMATDAPAAPSPRRNGLVYALGAVALLAVGGLAWTKLRPPPPARSDATTAPSPVVTAASPAPAVGADITLHITAIPAEARITIDDAPPVALPLTTRVKRDDRDHRFHIEAEGYESRDVIARYTSDQTMNLELTRSSTSGSAKGGSAPGPRNNPNPSPRTVAQVPVAPPPVAAAPIKTTASPTPSTPAPSDAPARKGKPGEALDRDDPWSAKH